MLALRPLALPARRMATIWQRREQQQRRRA
jgi:hypothetical protein